DLDGGVGKRFVQHQREGVWCRGAELEDAEAGGGLDQSERLEVAAEMALDVGHRAVTLGVHAVRLEGAMEAGLCETWGSRRHDPPALYGRRPGGARVLSP